MTYITGTDIKTGWTYNSADLVASMTYPGNNQSGTGKTVNYNYHNQLSLNSVTGGHTYVQSSGYDAAGRLVGGVRGPGLLTSSFSYYDWNAQFANAGQGGRLRQMTTSNNLQNLTYTYDKDGNILSILDVAANPAQTQTFTYNTLNRLASAVATGGTAQDGVSGSRAYAYDARGRLSGLPGMGTYGYSSAHLHAVERLDGAQKYFYDENGNMTRRIVGALTYDLAYDAENRLVSVTTSRRGDADPDPDGDLHAHANRHVHAEPLRASPLSSTVYRKRNSGPPGTAYPLEES